MKQLFKNILVYAKRYPFTFTAIIISSLLGLFMFVLGLDVWRPTCVAALGILPAFIFILGAYLWQKIFKDKHKIIQGIFLFFINFMFLFCQLGFSLILIMAGPEYVESRPFNNYKRYQEVIKRNDEYLKDVFPSEIPKDAQNIRMSGNLSSPLAVYYKKNIALSFNSTPEYMEKELKRFNKFKPYTYNKTDDLERVFPAKHMDDGDFDVYFVLDKTEHHDINHENSFRGGCMINKDTNRIIYYYQKIYGDFCHECYK